jgi:hypothetical protein
MHLFERCLVSLPGLLLVSCRRIRQIPVKGQQGVTSIPTHAPTDAQGRAVFPGERRWPQRRQIMMIPTAERELKGAASAGEVDLDADGRQAGVTGSKERADRIEQAQQHHDLLRGRARQRSLMRTLPAQRR